MSNEGTKEVIDLVTEHMSVETVAPGVVSVPTGRELESLRCYEDERLEAPRRRKGVANVTTLLSFIDHVNRFKDDDSAIFAIDDQAQPSLRAVLDYHRAGAGSPRFGEHQTRYRFPLSDPWKAWVRLSEAGFVKQEVLVAFLEAQLDDVLDPAAVGEGITAAALKHAIQMAGPTRLTELARGLSITVDQKVMQQINPSTGESSLAFSEEHRDEYGGPLKIPNGFAIAIPVFRSGALYSILVRLRHRVSRGAVLWAVKPHRLDVVFADAFAENADAVVEATDLPLFYGTPEAN